MLPVNKYLKKYIYRIIFCVCIFLPSGAQADILTFDSILYRKELNGDKYNNASWTALKFEILNPVVGTRRYLNRSIISFTLDTDRVLNYTRTEIRIGPDWLRNRKFKSSDNKWNNFWVGSGGLKGTQISDIRTFDNDEKVVFAWIIANSDELINYALSKQKNMPKRSRLTWERMARGQKFERNVRRFLGASARAELKQYDNFSHSKLILKNTIQPKLKLLNYYNGAIDGIGGPKTTKAIKAFEKENGLLIDGKLFGRERKLLVKLADQKSAPKKIYANNVTGHRTQTAQTDKIANQTKTIKTLRKRISTLVSENYILKSDIKSNKKPETNIEKKLNNTIKGQKNIIKLQRKRVLDLIEERNKLRDNNNGVISTDPKKYKDLVNTTDNQRKIIKTLRSRISNLSKERNRLIEDKSGGSNKYLITSLENELNTLQIRYDVILKQRDKFRKAATQGGSSLSATADNQRKIIKTLRERISSLIKERNTLRSENYIASNKSSNLKKSEARVAQLESEIDMLNRGIKFSRNKVSSLQQENIKLQLSLDSSAGNSAANKNQLSNLQDKYQKLYKENNTIKVDFDKLDRNYKQLASDFEAKGNEDLQRLTKINEELSISLQKQKILAYDAISQKSDIEKDLKITRAESNRLGKQLSDLSNVSTLNSSLKSDLSEARYQINSLKDELAISKNGASADLDEATDKIAELEAKLKKSKDKYIELESQISSSKTSQQKGFVLSSEWDELKQWITPQQIRFCTILSDYDREKVAAQESGNQLKQNLAIDNRDADIDALLLGRNSQEKGYFRNWIGTVEQVFAIYQENADGEEELAAGVVIKTPCNNVTVGSGRVKSADEERYEGTAFPSDPIYTQLSQVSKGDPILFEGSLLTYQDTGEANRSSKPRFFTNVDSSVNDVEAEKAKKKDKINAPDYFVKIDYLSKL
jgi:peptidoglycan hydrolase-like protein with peptidoglycan-binding domain